jgi:hypothetical protein
MDGHRPGRWFLRHPHCRPGTRHHDPPGGLVYRPAALQRTACRYGRGVTGPGSSRPARSGVRNPGRWNARRVGQCHLPGQTVHGQPAGDVSCPVRDRWMLHPAWSPTRPTTCSRRSAAPWPRSRNRYFSAHSGSSAKNDQFSVSASTRLSTSRLLYMCCRTRTPPPKISAC